jgi:hypothetical protein
MILVWRSNHATNQRATHFYFSILQHSPLGISNEILIIKKANSHDQRTTQQRPARHYA